jgi:asparagine synthase (glutamine-hydrolysing)
MCGIAGFWQPPDAPASDLTALARGMADALAHRGPDDAGVWSDPAAGIALSHRRLSIVDLSPEGHQPMRSAHGRHVVVFNGEIYNYRELRAALEAERAAPPWRGHSDTEVLLAAIEQWGLEEALRRFVGMFAFALWDARERALHLVRDRMGEKPLYYGWAGRTLVFGSELKALCAFPGFHREVDRDALALYLRYACVPAPYSIFTSGHKLLPGTFMTIGQQDFGARRRPRVQPYWTLAGAADSGARTASRGGARDLTDELDRTLRTAVAGQMVADVPLGAFLSGGIDSSTVVALMQAQSSRPVRTFSIGFEEAGYDEAVHAKRVAQHLGTDHTELYITPQDALAVVPSLAQIYDEPFADASQVPTVLVSQLARRSVTVSLSGDGGDELFGGYNRYRWGRRVRNWLRWMPASLQRAMARAITARPAADWDRLFDRFGGALPGGLRYGAPGDKLHKLAGLLGTGSDELLYQRLVSFWADGTVRREAAYPVPPGWIAYGTPSSLRSLPERMMYLDGLGYLPDDILVKVDRAAMSVSLETRVPLLDHRVVELAWRLPLRMKLRGGQGKWLLRRVLDQYVPRALVERPKQGFAIPLESWLRGPLRDWAEALLDESRLRREGFLDHAAVRRRWDEHLSGARNWQYHLWIVLMFQAWLDRWHGTQA